MEFGLFYQLPCGPDQSTVDRYDDMIAEAQVADRLGFDSIWLAELHFNSRFSVMPAPLLAAAAIYLQDRGPVFYRQERVGLYGRSFYLFKFRSMRVDAEEDGVAQWAKSNDSRVTVVGGVIRLTRIDEIPQIFNVLRGEMSFIGPRPERPNFVANLIEAIPYYGYRDTVKPGITGWAQVCFQYASSLEDSHVKLQYDLYYVKNLSLWLDFKVLIRTVRVVLQGSGAR